MRAHEWTRARQRSVRQISEALGDLGEEDEAEAAEPEPSLLTDEPEADAEPEPSDELPEVVEEEPPPEEAVEPAEADELAAAPPDEVADQIEDIFEAQLAEEERHGMPDDGVSLEPVREPLTASEAETLAPSVRPPRPRRRRSAGVEQAQLPLGLDPVVEKPTRRSATETREDLIQRLLDPHLTLQETAKLLNVCPTTVRRYTNRGLLAHYRTPGNQRRFRLSDVLAFMERQGIPAHGLERKRSTLMEEGQEPEEDAP